MVHSSFICMMKQLEMNFRNSLQIVCFCCFLFRVQLSVIFATMMAQRDWDRVCIIYFYDNTTANLAGISASKIIIKYSAHTFCQSTTQQYSPHNPQPLWSTPPLYLQQHPGTSDLDLGLSIFEMFAKSLPMCSQLAVILWLLTDTRSSGLNYSAASWADYSEARRGRWPPTTQKVIFRGLATANTSTSTHDTNALFICCIHFLGVYHSFYCDSD